MTSKGRVTIPIEVREALGVTEGDRLEFVEVAKGRFEMIAATRSVKEMKAMFGKPLRSVAREDVNEVNANRMRFARRSVPIRK